MAKVYNSGDSEVWLNGEKLSGEYSATLSADGTWSQHTSSSTTWVGGGGAWQCVCSANGNTGPCTCQSTVIPNNYYPTVWIDEMTDLKITCIVCGEDGDAQICPLCEASVKKVRETLILDELKKLCE